MDKNENRREFFRHQFLSPICGNFTLKQIGDTYIPPKSTLVCVKDISASGIRFEMHLDIPIRNDLIVELTVNLCGNERSLDGLIIRKRQLENGYFEYGVLFINDEEEKTALNRLINEVSIKLRKSLTVRNCNLCAESTRCHKNISREEKLRERLIK